MATASYFCYNDNEPKRPFTGRGSPDATKAWLKHYSNLLFLNFIDKNEGQEGRPRLTFSEKRQVQKELQICQRKLDYWQRHPGYNTEEATRGAEQLKAMWQQS